MTKVHKALHFYVDDRTISIFNSDEVCPPKREYKNITPSTVSRLSHLSMQEEYSTLLIGFYTPVVAIYRK
jgi:hypothetical protein